MLLLKVDDVNSRGSKVQIPLPGKKVDEKWLYVTFEVLYGDISA